MKKILVVDDEKSVRESIKMILEYEKYAVEFAANGEQCNWQHVQMASFHIVLLWSIRSPHPSYVSSFDEVAVKELHHFSHMRPLSKKTDPER